MILLSFRHQLAASTDCQHLKDSSSTVSFQDVGIIGAETVRDRATEGDTSFALTARTLRFASKKNRTFRGFGLQVHKDCEVFRILKVYPNSSIDGLFSEAEYF